MNIWLINHYIDIPGKGRYTRFYNFARELKKRGHEVTLFTASTTHGTDLNVIKDNNLYREENIDGLDFVYVRASNYQGNGMSRIKNMIEFYENVKRVAKKYKGCDVVYASSPHPLTWLAAKKIAKNNRAKLVCETRDLWPETFVEMGKFTKNAPPVKVLYAIEKSIYTSADALVFTMPGGKDYLVDKGIYRDRVYNINNGVVLEEFNENKIKYNVEDSDLDNKDIFKVVYTGAIGIANQVDILIDAMYELKDYDKIKLFIYGKGQFEDELKVRVEERNQKNVVFKGVVDKREVPSIVSKSDLNIVTSKDINLYRYGMSFNKLFEYLAAGKPVVSNLKCKYDIVVENDCGLAVKSGSPKALADGILHFYKMDKDEYDGYCKRAYETSKNFDFGVLTDRLINICETVLENK